MTTLIMGIPITKSTITIHLPRYGKHVFSVPWILNRYKFIFNEEDQ